MTKTFPFKEYRIQFDRLWTKATRTRNAWSETHTHKFVCYNYQVENVMYIYKCSNPDCPSKSVLYANYMKPPYPAWQKKVQCCECKVELVTDDYCGADPVIAP